MPVVLLNTCPVAHQWLCTLPVIPACTARRCYQATCRVLMESECQRVDCNARAPRLRLT